MLDRFATWQLVVGMITLLVTVYLAFAQAFTLGWLSSFDVSAERLRELQRGLWIFAGLGIALLIAELLLVAALIFRALERRKTRRDHMAGL